ncbi:hypothetical protein BKA62DRAFT_43897 [Auriculariales sp. MPI-PUGE-AT-0066]|nr:hypothetical protein BKA62DRAFT_43897 [Auriculariales sp. MPI-PUGE-AT-0066]
MRQQCINSPGSLHAPQIEHVGTPQATLNDEDGVVYLSKSLQSPSTVEQVAPAEHQEGIEHIGAQEQVDLRSVGRIWNDAPDSAAKERGSPCAETEAKPELAPSAGSTLKQPLLTAAAVACRSTRFTSEVLCIILDYLTTPYVQGQTNLRQGHFKGLVAASHVSRFWRAVAMRPELWMSIHSLGIKEMENINELLCRSGDRLIHIVSLQFVTSRKFNFTRTFTGLTAHWHRFVAFEATASPRQFPVLKAFFRALRDSRATNMQSFRLECDAPIRLPLQSFGEDAPRLHRLVVSSFQLPEPVDQGGPRVLRSVRAIELLDERLLSHHILRQVLDAVPQASDLTIKMPLLDAAYAERDWTAPTLSRVKLGEATTLACPHGADIRDVMIPTLAFLHHRVIRHLHLVAPHASTVRYVLSTLEPPEELRIGFDSGVARIILRSSAARYTRVISDILPIDLNSALGDLDDGRGWFKDVVSFSISMHVLASAWETLHSRLGIGAMRAMQSLTIAVPYRPPARRHDAPSMLDTRQLRWKFQSLRLLVLAADIGDVDVGIPYPESEQVGDVFTVRVSDLLAFIQDGLELGSPLQKVVLRGVRLIEQFTGVEVDELRRCVGNVVMES